MKGPLTAKYASIIEKREFKATPRLFLESLSLVWAAYRSEKLVESISFLIWELFHRFRLFSRDDYLVFQDEGGLSLKNQSIDVLDSNSHIAHFFRQKGLSLVKANQDWKFVYENGEGTLFGNLYSDPQTLYLSRDGGQTITPLKTFPKKITSIYISSRDVIFVCIKGTLYRSLDLGDSFEKSLDLSSPAAYFRRDYGMTETPDNTLVMGEYGNLPKGRGWTNMAYLYFSQDDGQTWQKSDFLRQQGANKHVHFIWYSQLLNKLIVTDGDNKKRMWVSDELPPTGLKDPQWNLVNRFHIQMGGHTAVIENNDRLLFGTDYMGGTNFILESSDGRTFRKMILPDPYRRSPIMILTHRKSIKGNEIWALLPYSTAGTRSLLMLSQDGGNSWHRVIEYSGAEHGVQIIGSAREPVESLYLSVKNVKNNSRAVYKITDSLHH